MRWFLFTLKLLFSYFSYLNSFSEILINRNRDVVVVVLLVILLRPVPWFIMCHWKGGDKWCAHFRLEKNEVLFGLHRLYIYIYIACVSVCVCLMLSALQSGLFQVFDSVYFAKSDGLLCSAPAFLRYPTNSCQWYENFVLTDCWCR